MEITIKKSSRKMCKVKKRGGGLNSSKITNKIYLKLKSMRIYIITKPFDENKSLKEDREGGNG